MTKISSLFLAFLGFSLCFSCGVSSPSSESTYSSYTYSTVEEDSFKSAFSLLYGDYPNAYVVHCYRQRKYVSLYLVDLGTDLQMSQTREVGGYSFTYSRQFDICCYEEGSFTSLFAGFSKFEENDLESLYREHLNVYGG